MFLELSQAETPEPLILSEPLVCGPKRTRCYRIQLIPAYLAAGDQPRTMEHAQVLRNRGPAEREAVRDHTGRPLTFREELQDATARWVTQCMEHGVEIGCCSHNALPFSNRCHIVTLFVELCNAPLWLS